MRKCANVFFAALFVLFLLAVPALTAGNLYDAVSYYENRALAPLPSFDAGRLRSGEYFGDWESWLTDHAAGRTTLLRLDAWLGLEALRLPVVNETVTGAKVLLRYNEYGTWDTSYLSDWAGGIGEELLALEQEIGAWGGSFYYLGLPEQSTYFLDKYPDYLESRDWNIAAVRAAFAGALDERGVNYIDGSALYASLGGPDAFYCATDHHYTVYGAFAAYRAVMERMSADTGLELDALQEEDVDFVTLPNPFMGSHNRKLFGLRDLGEKLAVGVLKQPVPFTRLDDGSPAKPSVLALPADGQSAVTYDVFMGGDHAETIIQTGRPELPDLLIFGDSFTNALETLIYAGFDETRSLDLRYYDDMTLRQYLAQYKPDFVLCVRDDTAFFTRTGNGRLD